MESSVQAPEERKSTKYKSFPEARLGLWGPEVREKHYDKLDDAIMGRIKHVSSRIDQYLPPYAEHYGIDQSLAINLENSFDELAQLYLQCAKEGYGQYLYPLKEDGNTYSYEPIKVFDEKLEKIQELIINAETPLFEEKNEVKNKDLTIEEKNILHEQGVKMLKEAVEKIHSLTEIIKSRSPLI